MRLTDTGEAVDFFVLGYLTQCLRLARLLTHQEEFLSKSNYIHLLAWRDAGTAKYLYDFVRQSPHALWK